MSIVKSVLNIASEISEFPFFHYTIKDDQRNLQDSIQMPDITKKNLNVHFILEILVMRDLD